MKASPKRANYRESTADQKPGELSMDRVNPDESREEARTRCCCKNMG